MKNNIKYTAHAEKLDKGRIAIEFVTEVADDCKSHKEVFNNVDDAALAIQSWLKQNESPVVMVSPTPRVERFAYNDCSY